LRLSEAAVSTLFFFEPCNVQSRGDRDGQAAKVGIDCTRRVRSCFAADALGAGVVMRGS